MPFGTGLDPNLIPGMGGTTYDNDGRIPTDTDAAKIGEAGMKLGESGQANNFSGITPGVVIKHELGLVTVKQEVSNVVLGTLGISEPVSVSVADFDAVNTNSGATDKFKIVLNAYPRTGDPSKDTIVLDVMPSIDEGRSANYEEVNLIHHPGTIMKYRATSNRTWRIAADLVSRTTQEAEANFAIMNVIRSWVMPYYGTGTAESHADKLGAPPPIIIIKGYGEQMIGPVPTVLTNYQWTFENDIDYLPRMNGQPFPVRLKVSMDFSEAYSPAEYTKFDLDMYRDARLPEAYGGSLASSQMSGPTTIPGGASQIDVSEAQSISQPAVSTASDVARVSNNIKASVIEQTPSIPITKPTFYPPPVI